MKTKRLFSIILLFVLIFSPVRLDAQDVLNGIFVKEKTMNRKPVPYQYLREADVMWSKTVWREIQLKEKMNHPLYYPEKPIGDRMSLIDLLMWGIQNKGLTAYSESDGNEFAATMTVQEIEDKFGAITKTVTIEDVETGEFVETTIEEEYSTTEVKRYLIKEMWFFDKQRSVLDVRIIGIAPIREYVKTFEGIDEEEDEDTENVTKVKLFWVYFPEARTIFANHEVFNPNNDAERKSFDDIFFKRYFSSYIAQESNPYNNRLINEYTIGLECLLEAERIKERIFNFEQDLWEY